MAHETSQAMSHEHPVVCSTQPPQDSGQLGKIRFDFRFPIVHKHLKADRFEEGDQFADGVEGVHRRRRPRVKKPMESVRGVSASKNSGAEGFGTDTISRPPGRRTRANSRAALSTRPTCSRIQLATMQSYASLGTIGMSSIEHCQQFPLDGRAHSRII